MLVRNVLATIVSLIAWYAVFFFTAAVMAVIWPDFGALVKVFRETGEYRFGTGMLTYLLTCWVLSDYVAGFTCSKIATAKQLWILPTFLIFAYSAYAHYYLLWTALPTWYNLCVPIVAWPFAYLGSRLVGNGRVSQLAVA
jgi:hypothetical protein